jgi:hypothetical protein
MIRRPNYQDISWFLDLNRNKQLDLEPSYQRRSVWSSKDRKFFLDTIFRNYPSPSIFLHKETAANGSVMYHVVDGKQRLETILKFVDNKIRIASDFGDVVLNGKRWVDLEGEPTRKKVFWDYVLPVELIDLIDGTVVGEVFDRLNRNSRKLERQELRHAKFDGWLIERAESEAEKDEWSDWKVTTKSRARRMKDVQFISELLLVILEREQRGFSQDGLDEAYGKYELPEDEEFTFAENDALEVLTKVKSVITQMETANGCITTHIKTFNAFYTLWALLVLGGDNLPDPPTLALRVSKFMERVVELDSEADVHAFLEHHADAASYSGPLVYLNNSRGASTDLFQRKNRFHALMEAVR